MFKTFLNLLIASAICASAIFLPPLWWGLPLLATQAIYLWAINRVLAQDENPFAQTQIRDVAHFLLLIIFYFALIALLIGAPVLRLLQTGAGIDAIWVSAGFVLASAALWRYWPLLGLLGFPGAAKSNNSGDAVDLFALKPTTLSSRWQQAAALSRQHDAHFSRGLPASLAMVLCSSAALAYALFAQYLNDQQRLIALAVFALLLAPLASALVWLRLSALLRASDAKPDPQPAATETPALRSHPLAEPGKPALEVTSHKQQLFYAASSGQTDIALGLLSRVSDVNAQPDLDDKDQRNLAMIAATTPDLRFLRGLIARGADLNNAVGGLTPLLCATRDSFQGRPEAVMTLITNGADARIADGDGNTPLHYAALCGEAAVAAILIDAGADLHALNRENHTPLARAAVAGNIALMKFLLERNARCETARGTPALIAACSGSSDNAEIVQLLLKHRAQVNACDGLGRTALHAAALQGHADMAEALLSAGVEVNTVDNNGSSALMDAARAGENRVITRMVFYKPQVNIQDSAGRSALIIACQSRRASEETVRLLLMMDANRELIGKDGKRAIDFALQAGRWPEVALLDPKFSLPTNLQEALDERNQQADAPDRLELLAESLRLGRLQIARELLQLTPHLEAAQLADLLVASASRCAPESLQLLIANGELRDAKTSTGISIIATLVSQKPPPLNALQLMIAQGFCVEGAGVLATFLENAENTLCSPTELEPVALAMLDSGADAFGLDSRQRSTLQLAVLRQLESLCQRLLVLGVYTKHTDKRGRSAMHELSALSEPMAINLAEKLLRFGADPELAAADGQTPKGSALAAGRSLLATWLTWSHWKLPGRALLATDLVAAASLGDLSALQRLLEMGLEINARDAQGCTALLRACGRGHAQIVEHLLARGANSTLVADTGASCLSAAVSAGREAIVAQLLDQGVSVDQRLPGGATAVMVGVAIGSLNMVKLLLKRGADVNLQDENGNTTLHALCQFAYLENQQDMARQLLRCLIDAGVAINQVNLAAQTPLLILLGAAEQAGAIEDNKRIADFAELLIQSGADVSTQDARGVGVLHAAAMHGLLDAVRVLLKHGASLSTRDHLGRTAFDVATRLGFIDVAAMLKRAD